MKDAPIVSPLFRDICGFIVAVAFVGTMLANEHWPRTLAPYEVFAFTLFLAVLGAFFLGIARMILADTRRKDQHDH